MNTRTVRFWLDGALGVDFLLLVGSGLILVTRADVVVLGLTGHEWGALHALSSAALALGVLAHLLLNWKWIKGVVHPRAKPAKVRWQLWTNGGLLAMFLLALLSAPDGRSLREALFPGSNLLTLHAFVGLALAGLVLLHAGLHRAWIASAFARPRGRKVDGSRRVDEGLPASAAAQGTASPLCGE